MGQIDPSANSGGHGPESRVFQVGGGKPRGRPRSPFGSIPLEPGPAFRHASKGPVPVGFAFREVHLRTVLVIWSVLNNLKSPSAKPPAVGRRGHRIPRPAGGRRSPRFAQAPRLGVFPRVSPGSAGRSPTTSGGRAAAHPQVARRPWTGPIRRLARPGPDNLACPVKTRRRRRHDFGSPVDFAELARRFAVLWRGGRERAGGKAADVPGRGAGRAGLSEDLAGSGHHDSILTTRFGNHRLAVRAGSAFRASGD